MYHPAHIDGCTVVILRRKLLRYAVMESGHLSFDGEELSLVTENGRRAFSAAERAALKDVVAGNRIPECRGFELFLIQ